MNYIVVIPENRKTDVKVQKHEHDKKMLERLCKYVELSGEKIWQKQKD